MSCGKPHDTDCSQVLAEVWRLLDGECSGEERLKLEQHLDECGPCLEQYGIEEHLKELLARKCGGDHAPDGLKAKLRASIRQVVVDSDGAIAVETSVRVTEERH
ncbi:MAG TPA: mycothiol system anti-sigma-R factor [Pseudonocardiaceae bacterium]|nr:mycothiol system anti-sigma-R factor [Pseudonocardiaceae bacterium]